MKNQRKIVLQIFLTVFFVFVLPVQKLQAQSLYFPPLSSDNNWDTLSPVSLGWCMPQVDSLYDYLQQQNSKAFILLKDGKIVLERYFGTFTRDSSWYWASAGKTITAFLIGKALQEGLIGLQDTSSQYLGQGWTSCTSVQEDKIKIIHQLTMSSGLNDAVPDNHCTIDTCLQCLADPGTRWAYHNAPYTLLESILANASGVSVNAYTQSRLKVLTGMTGFWQTIGYDNVFISKARSMARFGLLAQNKFVWNNTTLLSDTMYVHNLTNTSQNMNLSYGYLWWLNGKSSYMLPGFQLVIPGFLAPHAPADMFCGIGKNGQLVSVSRSAGLVMVRMGNDGTGNEVATTLLDNIWEKLQAIMCSATQLSETVHNKICPSISPNPASQHLVIQGVALQGGNVSVHDMLGNRMPFIVREGGIDISSLRPGVYLLRTEESNQVCRQKFIKTE